MKDYITLLGVFFYAPQDVLLEKWKALPEDAKDAFLQKLFKEGFSSWAVHKLGEQTIPKKFSEKTRGVMQRNMVHAMRDEIALRELYALFEREKIRFIPIKGIDLTYRIYDSPSLRPFGDWDVFFHPEDINRARELLMAQGWKEILEQDQDANHHFSPLVKDKHVLEPHWTLSCCMKSAPEEIWNLSRPVPKVQMRRALTPELNLLLIARHAAEDLYRSVNLAKMLLDAASIIKRETVDWQKGRQVSEALHQPYFGNLFAAFPEFFPVDMIQAMQTDDEQVTAFRQVFEHHRNLSNISVAEIMMQSDERFSAVWFKRILRIFFPKNLRFKYDLPEQGAFLRLIACYFREGWSKCSKFLGHFAKDQSELEAYCRLIRIAEKR